MSGENLHRRLHSTLKSVASVDLHAGKKIVTRCRETAPYTFIIAAMRQRVAMMNASNHGDVERRSTVENSRTMQN